MFTTVANNKARMVQIPNEFTVVLPFMAAEPNGRFFAPPVRTVDLMNNGELQNPDVVKEMRFLADKIIRCHPEYSKCMAYTDRFTYNGQKTIYTSDKIKGGLISTLFQEVVLDMIVHDIYRVNVIVQFETAGYARR